MSVFDPPDKKGIDGTFLKLYRKLRASGMKHRQAFEEATAKLSAPKEKNERRKEKPNKRRR